MLLVAAYRHQAAVWAQLRVRALAVEAGARVDPLVFGFVRARSDSAPVILSPDLL